MIFAVKKRNLGSEICIQLKINRVETKYGVWMIITVICVIYVLKNFLDSRFSQAVIDKISIFQEIAPNFTCSQKF